MAAIDDIEIPTLLFDEQASTPATPAAGKWREYFKSDGKYIIDDTGTETGPLGSGGALPGAWTAYTPAWTGNGATQPAIGDATIDAAYVQLGKTVMFRMSIAFGGTSTYGDGRFRFSLPVASKALGANHGLNITGYAENNGVLGYLISAGQYISSTTFSLVVHDDGGGDGALDVIGHLQPFTWGSGDYIRVFGFYEAA